MKEDKSPPYKFHNILLAAIFDFSVSLKIISMVSSLLDSLPRPLQSAVHSAGYRVTRWAAARTVLGNRLGKKRLTGLLGQTLEQWGVPISASVPGADLRLAFGLGGGRLWLTGGALDQPLERALLHLPALRGFWRQELRQKHFNALLALVPQAWVPGNEALPPGAVIHGLGIASWDQLDRLGHRIPAVVPEGHFLVEQNIPDTRLNATYGRGDKTHIVLRSVEALS